MACSFFYFGFFFNCTWCQTGHFTMGECVFGPHTEQLTSGLFLCHIPGEWTHVNHVWLHPLIYVQNIYHIAVLCIFCVYFIFSLQDSTTFLSDHRKRTMAISFIINCLTMVSCLRFYRQRMPTMLFYNHCSLQFKMSHHHIVDTQHFCTHN